MKSKWIKRAPLLGALGLLAGAGWWYLAEVQHERFVVDVARMFSAAANQPLSVQAHTARGPLSTNAHAAMDEQCSSESNTGIAEGATQMGTGTTSSSATGDAHDTHGTRYGICA